MKKKKYLALFLGLSMALTAAPVGVYANPGQEQDSSGNQDNNANGGDTNNDETNGGETATTVTLDESSLAMEIGDTATLTATVSSEGGETSVTWIVDKDGDYVQDEESIVTVTPGESNTATVTANAEGTTTVVAKIVDANDNGKVVASDTCEVSVTKSLADLVNEASAGATINLNRDYTLKEALTIDKNLTINGNGHTISGIADNTTVNIQLTGAAKVTIKNTKFDGFGDKAKDTAVGFGVIKIGDGTTAELIAEKLTFANFNRAAIDARSGKITVKNCNIDCDIAADNKLTKGIVAYTDATITGGRITGAGSKWPEWCASGIETCAGAEVTVKDVTIENSQGGIEVARNFGSAGTTEKTSDAVVTVENCTITADDFALCVFQGQKDSPAKDNTTAKLTVNGGKYKGDVRIEAKDVDEDENNHIVINSGYFTIDPEAFVADGKVSAQSTLSGYNFMVVDKKDVQTIVKPATGETEVTTKSDAQINEKVQAEVNKTAKSVKAEDSVLLDQAKAVTTGTTEATAKAALEAAGITTEGATVTVYRQAYLDVVITGADNSDTTVNTLTLEITPMVKEIASTATTAAGIVTEGEDGKNAVQIGEAKALTINTPSEITVTTPFKSKTVYVTHVKADERKYSYSNTSEANGKLTFTSKYGFSEFTFSETRDANIVAETGGVGYITLQEAVNAVENGGTITIVKEDTYEATTTAAKSSFEIVKDGGVTNASWKLTVIKKSSGSSSSGGSSGGGSSSSGGGSSSTKTDTDKKAEDVKQDETKDEAKGDEIAKKMTILMQIGSNVTIVDGAAKTGDVAPVIRNSRTLVPIRMITEALGGQVAWNAETKAVTLTIDGKEIQMVVGQTLAKYGVAPEIIGDRTFVPVRFVTDELGATIAWDDATKGITITK